MHDKFIRKNEKMHRTRTFTTGQQVWLHRVYPGITKPAANGQNKSFFWPFRPDVYVVHALYELRKCKGAACVWAVEHDVRY